MTAKRKPRTAVEHIAALEHWAAGMPLNTATNELRAAAIFIADLNERKPAIPPTLRRLNAEMRFLERMVVEVRLPLVYGSRHLFTASPTSVEGRGDEPSDLRKQIAAYLAAQKRKR